MLFGGYQRKYVKAEKKVQKHTTPPLKKDNLEATWLNSDCACQFTKNQILNEFANKTCAKNTMKPGYLKDSSVCVFLISCRNRCVRAFGRIREHNSNQLLLGVCVQQPNYPCAFTA